MLRVLQMQNTMTLTSNFYREETFSTLSLKEAYRAQKGLWYPINTERITVTGEISNKSSVCKNS